MRPGGGWKARLPPLLLGAALWPGGLTGDERPMFLLLAILAAIPVGAGPAVPRWLEHALVTYATGVVGWACWQFPVRHQPLGTDWYTYLQNAIAVAEGDWGYYTAWRGPLHAWLCVGLGRLVGGLIEASQLISGVSVTLLVPLTWALGRRLVGPLPAVFAALLLAGWPELPYFGRASTPYPLLALLFTAGALCATAERRAWRVAAGLLLGLGIATDPRGMALAGVVVVVSLGRTARVGLPHAARSAVLLGALALGVGLGLQQLVPVRLVPLSEQIALQRDLHASEGPGRSLGCEPRGLAFPTLGELVSPCATGTLRVNVERLQSALPLSLPWYGALALLGLRWRGAWLGLLPVVPMVPSLLLIAFQHRYAIPLAPGVALLFGAGLAGLVAPGGPGWRPLSSWARLLLVLGATAVLGHGLWNLPTAPLARATWGYSAPGAAPVTRILEPKGLAVVRQILRADAPPGDSLVDCARAGLRMRMYPTPVREIPNRPGFVPGACRALMNDPPDTPTWLLIALNEPIPAGWESRYSLRRPEGALTLLRTIGPAD